MKRIGIYAGSFDPPTLGHLWMIQQGAQLFDELVVVLGVNPDKKGFLSEAQRMDALRGMLAGGPANVRVEKMSGGFLVDYARRLGMFRLRFTAMLPALLGLKTLRLIAQRTGDERVKITRGAVYSAMLNAAWLSAWRRAS